MLAELRPKMTRYTSLDDITTALVELEEKERLSSLDKSSTNLSTDNPTNGDEDHAEGRAGRERPAGDSDSYESSVREDDEEEEGEWEGDDEDDEVAVRKKRAEIDPAELEDFDRQLKTLMQESLESRKQELRVRPATLNMMLPMNIFEGSSHNKEATESSEDNLDDTESGQTPSKVKVKVLVKRGNKQQTKQMFIPGECSLVQGVREKEQAEMEEKLSIKRRILEYNEREEDEANGVLPAGNWPVVGSVGGNGGSGAGGNGGAGGGRGLGRQRTYHVAGGGFYRGYGRRR